MMRRALFSLAVLSGTIYWANCQLVFPHQGPPPAPPAPNRFFAGCFQGLVTDPAGFGDVIVVLEASTDPKNPATLGGCLRWRSGNQTETDPIVGDVQEDRQQALLTLMPPDPPLYRLRVRRAPAGDVDATTLTLSNEGSAPFTSAADVPRCAPQLTRTCADLGIPLSFLPPGGTP